MENNRDRFLLIDANNLTLRALYGCAALYDSQGFPTGCLMTTIRTICKAAEIVQPKRTICFWDGGHSAYRKEIFPEYKLRQELDPDDPKRIQIQEWKDQCKMLFDFLPLLGIGQIKFGGHEADDLIYATSKILLEYEIDTTIATTDQDFMQMLSDNCNIFHLGRNNIYSREDMVSEYGVTPAQWVDFRAMTGDKSDNIAGVKGIGPKKAAEILNQLGTLDNFFAANDLDEFVNSKSAKAHHKSLAQSFDVIERNKKLMDLSALPEDCRPLGLEDAICKAIDLVPNPLGFGQFCLDHELRMVMSESVLWPNVWRE